MRSYIPAALGPVLLPVLASCAIAVFSPKIGLICIPISTFLCAIGSLAGSRLAVIYSAITLFGAALWVGLDLSSGSGAALFSVVALCNWTMIQTVELSHLSRRDAIIERAALSSLYSQFPTIVVSLLLCLLGTVAAASASVSPLPFWLCPAALVILGGLTLAAARRTRALAER